MDPLFIVINIFFKVLRVFLWLFKKIVKLGLFWLVLGYFINYVMIDNPTTIQHVLCMLLAWGGTFINIFGKRFIKFLSRKKTSDESMTYEK